MFNLLLLNLVPLNAQNETSKKVTSEAAVIKQNNQTTLTTKIFIHQEKPIAKVSHFLLLVQLKIIGLLLFKLQFELDNLKSKLLGKSISIRFKTLI